MQITNFYIIVNNINLHSNGWLKDNIVGIVGIIVEITGIIVAILIAKGII